MPAPETVDEFLELVRKSGVVDEARLSSYVQQLQSGPSKTNEPKTLAGYLVRDGILTYFQAEQFLQGKWRRFTIGKYKVLERLGSGGMGQVFLCEHKLMRRRVAVKVLPTAKAQDPSSLDRFHREARAVAALDHPNIVRAYDIDQDDNLHFLVMEYVDGASLQDIVKKFGPMDVRRACHYIYWSAVGLQHAHDAGLIHRDVKPGNILVDRQGVVKILDLGLARFFNDDDDHLTKKYDESVLGTADYLAPEQALDSHSVDGRADIYSLGATFYFLLTANQPFVEGTIAQKLMWHNSRDPKPIASYRQDVPAGVTEIVSHMMAKKPENRYQTPAEVAAALAPWVQEPIEPPPEREMPLLCAAVIAAGGGTVNSPAARSMAGSVAAPSGTARRGTSSSDHLRRLTGSPSGPGSGGPRTPPPQSGSAISALETARRPSPKGSVENAPTQEATHQVWESLTTETNPVSRADTEPPSARQGKGRATPQSSRLRQKAPGLVQRLWANRRYRYVALGAAGLFVVLLLARMLFRGSDGPVDGGGPRRLIVSASHQAGDHRFRTVKDAIESARPHDHIVIADDTWEEIVSIRTPPVGVVIEPADGKKVVWRLPARSTSAFFVLDLNAAEGLQFRGFTFQPQSEVESVIRVSGRCPGMVLEDLTLGDAKGAVIKFVNCVGDDKDRVVMRNCRITSSARSGTDVAVGFAATISKKGDTTTYNRNHAILVHDCRLDGPFRAAFQVEGGISAVELRHNRVTSVQYGVYVRRPQSPEQSLGLTVSGNSFFGVKGQPNSAAVRFESAALYADPKNVARNRLEVGGNYFAEANVLVSAGDDKDRASIKDFLTASGNTRDKATREGDPSLSAAEVAAPPAE